MQSEKNIQDIYPLSPMQSGMLFHSLFSIEDAYLMQNVFELVGDVDPIALNDAWQIMGDLHPILRTGFVWEKLKKPLQYILASAPVIFEEFIWEGLTTQNLEQKLKIFLQEDRTKGFNLTKAPLFRITLIKHHIDRYYLIWSQHHILLDGWSLPLILSNFLKAYQELRQKKEVHLKIPRPYRDYIAWLQQQDMSQAELFWKDYLCHVEAPTYLSVKDNLKKTSANDYEIDSIALSINETEAIKKFAKQNNLTLNTIIQGAIGIVLKTYFQQQDVVFGIAVSGRTIDLPGVEDMIGLFINTLPLRVSYKSEDTPLSFLQNLQALCQKLNDFAYPSLAQIQSWSPIDQSLFDVLFVFENYPLDENILPKDLDFTINWLQGIDKTEYPLTIIVKPGKQFNFSFCYQTAHFNEVFIKRFFDHLKQILQNVILNKDDPLQNISVLTQSEKLQFDRNDTRADYSSHKCVHQLFEKTAEIYPHHVAVVYEEQVLTYQQLNHRSNQLAHYLRSLGVGPDTLVAIAVERSLEMVIGILGILKAGGAYVPLDISSPLERLQFMLYDTQASILLTHSSLKTKFSSYHGKIFTFDHDTILQQKSIDNPIPLTNPLHLAYIIYTSGSTGKPKGIAMTHLPLTNLLEYNALVLRKNSEKYQGGVLQFASPAFDMSFLEIFTAFSLGTTLYIIDDQLRHEPLKLQRYLYQNCINTVMLPVNVLQQWSLLPEETMMFFNTVKNIIMAGEQLVMTSSIRQLLSSLHHCRLHNYYGPSETHVITTYEVNAKHCPINAPIGKSIPNTQAYILDSYLNLVPIGIMGELYLGGIGLARGYLNRPDLTAERYIPNPFVQQNVDQDDQNLRLYRTGDLAYYLPDGTIEFLGRIDHQVKIRGFRIELGEIESALNQHPHVTQAVVLVKETESEDKILVAYLTPKEAFRSSISSEDLTDHLIRSLPDYMIPSFFVFLTDFPLTKNGKIDHRALSTPNLTLRQLKTDYTAPQTLTEQQLASIWTEVLQIDKIGIHDHFFKIGGHSILATQIISRIRHHCNIDIPIRALFDNPTIDALSSVIDSINKEKNSSSIPSIVPRQRQGLIPLSFAQQRLWFLDKFLPDTAIYNIPLSLSLTGNLDKISLENAFNGLIQRHESLRTYFPTAEGKTYQEILPKFTIDILQSSINLEHVEKKEQLSIVEELARQESVIPFNLSIGPLIRAKLLILAKNEHVLLITFHHIISDGWSLKVFFKELSELYKSYSRGTEPFLPSLSIQYGDFTLWQRDFLQGKILEQQLGHWKQQLEGIPDLLVLPTDKPRPKEPSYKGASHQILLSKKLLTSLKDLAQEQQATLFMALLATLQILLHRYTGQKDIVIGSPISNRPYKETENIIGLFINTLALRTQFEHSYSFIDLLNQVQKTTLDAYQNQDVPFEQLVDYLKIARELNRNPIFQVMFTFQNIQEEATLSLEHLVIKPFNNSYPVAKFDLSFHVFEEKGEMNLSINYATDLFEMHTIERMANHFKELLQTIVNNPLQTISTYSILNYQEQQQILIGWNNTQIDFPNHCIHERFEATVVAYPHRTAVVFKEQTLTYQQLNHRANQLAHYFISIGIGPETLVAISVERSLEMVIGILAILKAGGAYVPLDQNYPPERLRFILQETQVSFLFMHSFLKTSFGDYSGRVITYDDQIIQKYPFTNPNTLTSSCHLAYVIYTSGSTGTPKGVQIIHQGVVSFLTDMKERIGVVKEDILLSVTSMLFDIFGLELYLPLITGAKLIITPQNIIKDGEALLTFLKQEHVTIMQATPATWHMLLEEGWKPNSNFKILHGGESLSQKLKESFQKMGVSCWNLYGPTETTIWSTITCINDCNQQSSSSLVGRPIGNTQIYILDSDLNTVPIGVVGEIYIGGIGLARGYLKRPDLTAEKFIPNLFIKQDRSPNYQNLRLYRTGDLGRYIPDGNIEFFGRIDHQVKVRGFRIELGEIESVLQSVPTVTQAIAITHEDIVGKKRLVAYIVASTSDKEALIKNCLEHCESQLPTYMIPNQIVVMNQFPLNSNGKIDRKVLPPPEKANSAEFIVPRNQLDRELRQIWAKILGLAEQEIGIYDDFFTMGGDSISSVQLVSQVKKTLGLSVSVKDIFSYTTIEKLSEHIAKHVSKNSANNLNDFEPYIVLNESLQGDHRRLFLFPPGNGGVESYLNNIASKLPHKNLVLFNNLYQHQKNKFNEDQLPTMTYENLASDYIIYIKAIQPKGPYQLFGWSFGGVLAFEIARQLMEKRDIVDNIVLLDAFFNYKTAVLITNTQTEEINYKYSPQVDRKIFSSNITLFKSSKICISDASTEKEMPMQKIYKYYAEKTKCNHLDDLLETDKIKIKIMDHTHDSWIKDEMQVLEVCKELDFA